MRHSIFFTAALWFVPLCVDFTLTLSHLPDFPLSRFKDLWMEFRTQPPSRSRKGLLASPPWRLSSPHPHKPLWLPSLIASKISLRLICLCTWPCLPAQSPSNHSAIERLQLPLLDWYSSSSYHSSLWCVFIAWEQSGTPRWWWLFS